ncbi:MAG TPA: hypothetical protein GX704_04190 [Clostridiales bacterium]|jgi:hypothetical protein|nr:hypothetical protein [Clostridiales bacterium]
MKLTLKSLFSNIWVNLLLVLSFAAGFIGIFISGGYIDAFFADISSYKIGSGDDGIVFVSANEPVPLSDWKFGAGSGSVVCGAMYSDDISGESVYLAGVDGRFLETHRFAVIEGRFFTSEEALSEEDICVAEKAAGLSVGDVFAAADLKLRVVGVIGTNNLRGRIFLPYGTLMKSTRLRAAVSDYIIAADSAQTAEKAAAAALKSYSVTKSLTSREYFSSTLRGATAKMLTALLLGAASLLLNLLQIGNIVKFNAENRIREYGILISLGADRAEIARRLFAEYFAVMLLSQLILILCAPVFGRLLKDIISWQFGLACALIPLLLSAAEALFIAVIYSKKICSRKPVELLRRLERESGAEA